MDRITWCLNIEKGLELVEPNKNLSKAYFLKAEDALRSAHRVKGIIDWEITASYYSLYFSAYALLMKIGVKSENHFCTIAFCERFLSDHLSNEEVSLLKLSCKARIDAQYYTNRIVAERIKDNMLQKAPIFLAKCKKAAVSITEKNIIMIRETVSKLSKMDKPF